MKNAKAEKAHNAPGPVANDALSRVMADPALMVAVGARLWALAEIPADRSACWLWKGARRGQHDYGSFKLVSYVTIMAHRAAYAFAKGEHPGDFFVCHTCDVPHCVNPDHLFLGTHAENMADMAAKGRAFVGERKGEKNHAAKLTEADAIEAIRLIEAGLTNKEIGRRLNIGHALISSIRRGKAWKHLPRPRDFPKYGSLKSRLRVSGKF